MSDYGRLATRSSAKGGEPDAAETNYLPRQASGWGAVRADREAAAGQIARTMKVWRKASGVGESPVIQRKAEDDDKADKIAADAADKQEETKAADEKAGGDEKDEKDGKGDDKKKGKAKDKKKGDANAALEDTKKDAEEGQEASAEGEKKADEAKADAPAEEAPPVAAKLFRAPQADGAAAPQDPKQAELDKKKQLLKKRVELAAKDAEVVQNAVKIITSAVTDAVSLITGPLAGLAAQGVIKNIMSILSTGANLAVTVQRDMQANVMNKAIENMSPEQIDAKIQAWNKDEPTFTEMKGQIDACIAEANEEVSLVDEDIEAEKAAAVGAISGGKDGAKNRILNAAGKGAAVYSGGKAIVSVAKAAAGVAAKESVKTGVLGFLKKVMDAVPVLGTAISIGVCVKSCIDSMKLRSEVEALEKDLGIGAAAAAGGAKS